MRPGTTKNVTLSDGWQRLATLCGSSNPEYIISADGKEKANRAWITIKTYKAEIAYSETMPSVSGHVFEVGDHQIANNFAFIKDAWLRNGTAGSNSVMVITAIYE